MLRSNIRTQRNTHTNQQATPMTLGANSVQNKNNIERNQRDVVNDCRDRTGGDRVDISIWGNSNQNVLLTDAGVDGNGSDSDKLKFQVTYNFSKKNNKTKDSHNHQQKMLRNTYSHINRNIPTNESIIK